MVLDAETVILPVRKTGIAFLPARIVGLLITKADLKSIKFALETAKMTQNFIKSFKNNKIHSKYI